MFSVRADGLLFDRFLSTKQQNGLESKNGEPGPAASPLVERSVRSSRHAHAVCDPLIC
jgi:hypothetical protein